MRPLRSLPFYVVASALLCSMAAMAQQFAPAVRIVNRIDESQLVTLKGNTHPAANAKNDQGAVSPSLPMTDLILVLSRDPAQQAAFDKFVASQYDSSSPNFHQWLTPEQVGTNFGPSETDIATISNWLTGHGFSIGEVTRDHMSIRFNGTASQVQSAFHTEIHNLSVKGVAHIGNMSDPQIPAALVPVVVGVKSLHNFFPRPLHRMGSQVTKDSATGKWQRVLGTEPSSSALSGASGRPKLSTATAATARPEFGINVTGSSPYLEEDVGPYDFATIYNILPLWNKSTPIDGKGQTIAIAGTSDIDVGQSTSEVGANGNNDVATFRNFFGLPTNIPANTPIRVSGNSQPLQVCTSTTSSLCGIDDLTENSLDVEWSASVAKNAQIVLVASYPASAADDNLYDSESYIVNNVSNSASPVYGVHIMNVSYGECELGNGTAGNVEYYDLWQQAAAEGIAVIVAAGDSGSASCDDGSYVAESGLSVSGLASTPWNTAVGGTDFNWCTPDTFFNSECVASPYWNSTTSLTTGVSVNASGPQAGYIPETPWNETCSNPLTLKWMQDMANDIYTIPVSDVANNEQGCNFVLDYSFTGEDESGVIGLGTTYPYGEFVVDTVGGSGGASSCVVGNPVTNSIGTVTGCVTGSTSTGTTTNPNTNATQSSINLFNNGWIKPSWQTGVSGIPSDGVRDLPDVSFFAADGYVSSSAYLICVSAVNPNNALCSYTTYTEPFYQEVGGTSVATPAMAGIMALINQKTGASQGLPNSELYALAAKQTYGSCSSELVSTSSSCYFNDIDQGTSAMPCDAVDATPNCTTTQSTFGFLDEIGILPGYSAGAGYDLATGLGSLNVANVVNAWTATAGTGAAKVTVTPGQSSIPSSQSLNVTGTVTGTGATPTGTVTLTAGTYTSSATLSSSGGYSFTVPGGSLSVGIDTLNVAYGGDGNYASSPANTATVTVTGAAALTPTVKVSPASSTLNSDASLSVLVTVTGAGPTPTGTVVISGGSYTSAPVQEQLNSSGSYTFTIPPNSLDAGSDTLEVTYSGDPNYAFASGTATVTVTESTFSLSQTPIVVTPSTIAPGASATATITVSTVAGYTGTVTLTCAQTNTTATGGDAAGCSIPNTAVSMGGTATATVTTTAPSSAALVYPNVRGKGRGWMGAGGGAVLALLVFLGIPARRRSWRSMLGLLVLIVALGGLISCGGGSSGGGGGGQTDPGTTAGTYTFTVYATGNPSVTPSVSTTFTVTVN
jgi:subtilase family serine protease